MNDHLSPFGEDVLGMYVKEKVLASQKIFMRKVYSWMTIGLALTTLVSFLFYSSNFIQYLPSGIVLILVLLQFIAVIALSGWAERMSTPVAAIIFLGYSVLTGITLSTIFIVYTMESIVNVFLSTTLMFGTISAWAFFTKKDLSPWGTFFFMGLIGIIIASLVNLFLASSALEFVISVVGVLVFAGLTAYDTQKIKEMHLVRIQGGQLEANTAIVGALILYLDFINLFIMLLRLFGNRR